MSLAGRRALARARATTSARKTATRKLRSGGASRTAASLAVSQTTQAQAEAIAAGKDPQKVTVQVTGKETAGDIVRSAREVATKTGVTQEEAIKTLSEASQQEARRRFLEEEQDRATAQQIESSREYKAYKKGYGGVVGEYRGQQALKGIASEKDLQRLQKEEFRKQEREQMPVRAAVFQPVERKLESISERIGSIRKPQYQFAADVPTQAAATFVGGFKSLATPIKTVKGVGTVAKGLFIDEKFRTETGLKLGKVIEERPGKVAGAALGAYAFGKTIQAGVKGVKKGVVDPLKRKTLRVEATTIDEKGKYFIKEGKVPVKLKGVTDVKVKTYYDVFGKKLFPKEYEAKIFVQASKVKPSKMFWTGYDVRIKTPKGQVPATVGGRAFKTGTGTYKEVYGGVVKTKEGLKELEGAILYKTKLDPAFTTKIPSGTTDPVFVGKIPSGTQKVGFIEIKELVSRAKPATPSYSAGLRYGGYEEKVTYSPKLIKGEYERLLFGTQTGLKEGVVTIQSPPILGVNIPSPSLKIDQLITVPQKTSVFKPLGSATIAEETIRVLGTTSSTPLLGVSAGGSTLALTPKRGTTPITIRGTGVEPSTRTFSKVEETKIIEGTIKIGELPGVKQVPGLGSKSGRSQQPRQAPSLTTAQQPALEPEIEPVLQPVTTTPTTPFNVPTPPVRTIRPPLLPEELKRKQRLYQPKLFKVPKGKPSYTPTLLGLSLPKIKGTPKLAKGVYSGLLPRPQIKIPKKKRRKKKKLNLLRPIPTPKMF